MPTNLEQKGQTTSYSQWLIRVQRWGLNGLLAALLDAAAPLAPIAGQALYVAQPTLGLFVSRQSITDLAQWLDRPEGLADLQRALASHPPSASGSTADPTDIESP